MPYINIEDRRHINDYNLDPLTAGELNYKITVICNQYLRDNKLSYSSINEIIGVLECAKQEFYRRVASPYEDQKMKENGDVYT